MYKILFLLLLSFVGMAQSNQQKILGEWIKDEITLQDGSAVLDDEVRQMSLRYIFMPNDSFMVIINGKTGKGSYKVMGDTLKIGALGVFKITRLDDIKLAIESFEKNQESYKFKFIPARLYNVSFRPETYITKGKDTIYVAKRNYLEPMFVDEQMNAPEFISEHFPFSEYKAGYFNTRFIITKDRQIKGIEILDSTHPKANEKLVKAIKATAGKWLSPTWEGKPINLEVKMVFDMGWSEKTNRKENIEEKPSVDSQESDFYLLQANALVEEKRYKAAIENLNQSISLNPKNIKAYYARASVFALTKDTQKMCSDLQQLRDLQQTKGTELWNKFCK